MGSERWIATRGSRGNEIAVSLFAEVAWRLGYLPEVEPISPSAWKASELNDVAGLLSRDWLRSELTIALPQPSLAFGGAIWCFAPEDRAHHWLYLDFDHGPPWDGDHLLRGVRLPSVKAIDGVILAPHGRTVATDVLLTGGGRDRRS